MSSTAAVADLPTPGSTRPAWIEIPRMAALLLWRHWPALLFWFFAQRVSYGLSMDAAIVLAERSVLLSYVAIAALIVAQLVCVVGMFLSLRPSLRLPPTRASDPAEDRPWVRALSVALIPFFAYYAAWGLLDGIRRDFTIKYEFGVSFDNRESLSDIVSLEGVWIAFVLAWVAGVLAKRRMAATGHGAWAVVVTLCEAYWIFVGVAVISKGLAVAREWWQSRVVYATVADWWQYPVIDLGPLKAVSLSPLKRVLDPLWGVVTELASAMSMPLIWLAITALVYGLDLRRQHRLDRTDAHLRYAARRYQGLHQAWHKLADRLSSGWSSKGVPLLNSIRLVLRAGLPALLTLCLGWQLLAWFDAISWAWVVDWVGALSAPKQRVAYQPFTLLFATPLNVRAGLITEVLRIVLLAATFSCAMAQLQTRASPRRG